MHLSRFVVIVSLVLLSACRVGPNYSQPKIEVPEKYKEARKGWKVAEPKDTLSRGEWWRIFKDPELNQLADQVNVSNQNIAIAAAQYRQATAFVNEAVAAYFPTVSASAAMTRQKTASTSNSSAGSLSNSNASSGQGKPFTNYMLSLNATWEPDLWGAVSRSVEASRAGLAASAAEEAAVRLSMQGSLAQFYFQLRAVDENQKLLDGTVVVYQKSLQLTKNRYAAGVASRLDILLAQTQLETAQTAAIDNGINRAQYEHAVAVLIGKPPGCFSLSSQKYALIPPAIPVQLPSALLERRPDVAEAERLAAQANAQIGVVISAFFPTLTLSATGGYSSNTFSKLFTQPARFWSLGPALAETIFDGGLRSAVVAAARANYDVTVASYRQVVLSAFQDVEDNLVSLRCLNAEAVVQKEAVLSAEKALQFTMNEYKAGTVAYSQVITAQTTLFAAKQTAITINGRRMVAAVGLIKALGGGWKVSDYDKSC